MRIFLKYYKDQNWHEVLRLICGMIDERFAGQIIEHLIAQPTTLRLPKIHSQRVEPPWHITLAIRCWGEIRMTTPNPRHTRGLLTKMCVIFDQQWLIGSGRAIPAWEHAAAIDQMRQMLRDYIINPVESIGTGWPYRGAIVDWIRYEKPSDADRHVPDLTQGASSVRCGQGDEAVRDVMLNYAKRYDETFLHRRTLCVGSRMALGQPDDGPVVQQRVHRP